MNGLRRTSRLCFVSQFFSIAKAPVSGYEISELPNERVLQNFMRYHKTKGVIVVLHSGDMRSVKERSDKELMRKESAVAADPLTRTFISSLSTVNLGNPSEVKIALVPGQKAPLLSEQFNVITYPTSLLFMNGTCVYRCVGARSRELSIKSLFMLRNANRNIICRE